MVSYLTLIDQVRRYNPEIDEIQFLVSGDDLKIKEIVFSNICNQAFQEKKDLIIIIDDSSEKKINFQNIKDVGFNVRDGFGAGCGFSNILNIRNMKGLSRFRDILDIMGYSSREKDKLIAYLNLIYHLEMLSNEGYTGLKVDTLSAYGATMLVEAKVQELLEKGKINREQQRYLLSKYMEVSNVGADFESSLYILLPFMSKTMFAENKGDAYIFSLTDFRSDITMKKLFFKGLMDSLEECDAKKAEVIILDGGNGKNNYLADLLMDFSDNCNVHMFTKDVFSMKDIEKVLNQFTARIYSRHSNMHSCEAVEHMLGKVLISRSSYTETYDNRLSANTPWDVLLGKNKVEAYTVNAPIWESKYPKEMISRLPVGSGIIEFQGESSIFNI